MAFSLIPVAVAGTQSSVFPDARVEVHEMARSAKLALHVFEPATGPRTGRPAIVFFSGVGQPKATPTPFAPLCRYLATHGVVGIVIDFQSAPSHAFLAPAGITKAKAAVTWLRGRAESMGLDASRINAAWESSVSSEQPELQVSAR